MFIDYFLEKYDLEIQRARPQSWGLLCNQSSWSLRHGAYLWELLNQAGILKRVFVPEHGLFAELQDQVGLDDTSPYQRLWPDLEFVSLYGSTEESLTAPLESLRDLDVLVIDVQDVGSRYYTFATTVAYLFSAISKANLELEVLVIERPNPAGPWIEGSELPESYESFVGYPGLPHRHGLTIGELTLFYKAACKGRFSLEVVYDPSLEPEFFFPDFGQRTGAKPVATEICPSPNMPTPVTPLVYSGQCLLEGTNLSEGRGTTRPFEIFGAPFLHTLSNSRNQRQVPLRAQGARLRPLRFLPTFHKHEGEICEGWQIHLDLDEGPYHSLFHSLRILHSLQEEPGFAWRSEEYEFRSDRPAIELLAGDPLLLEYLNGKEQEKVMQEHLKASEDAWLKKSQEFWIHKIDRKSPLA